MRTDGATVWVLGLGVTENEVLWPLPTQETPPRKETWV